MLVTTSLGLFHRDETPNVVAKHDEDIQELKYHTNHTCEPIML